MIKKILVPLILSFMLLNKVDAQQRLLSKINVNGFYTTTLDAVLDTLIRQNNIKIVFDRDLAQTKLISEKFNNEPLSLVLKTLCKSAELHYWVEPEGIIYIVKTPEDVRTLQRAQKTQQLNNNQIVRTITVIEQRTDTAKRIGRNILKSFKLTGRIVDQLSGESLPGAVVAIENSNIRATTNADGYFSMINIPADTCIIATSYVGYLSDRLTLTNVDPSQVLTIGLSMARNNLEEVTIKSKKNDGIMSTDKRKVSVLQISPAKLAELPSLGEKDILRAFQLMPGVSASNESSSGAYVRGGTPDQNLVLFDGFTVYQVDHLYGFFSAFNSNAVKDVQLFKGGFSAKYGGRLSSVTEITGKEGTKKDWNVGGDLSLLSANVYLETPVKKNGSFLLALRKSYQGPLYNKIFSQFNKTSTVTAGGRGGFGGGAQASTTPTSYFYDLNAKYTLNIGKKDLFAWSLYQGNDDLDNSRTTNIPSFLSTSGSSISPTVTDKTTYGNLGSSMKWARRWNSELYSNTLVSYSTYHSNRDRTNTIGETNADGTESEVTTGTIEKNKLKDWSFKSDWEYQVSNKTKFFFGGYGSAQNVTYKYSQNDTSTLIDQNKNAKIVALYAEGEFNPWEKLQFKVGVRENYYQETGKTYFEPRFSGSYLVTDRFTIKAATGKFYQFINRVVREDILSGSRDFWVLSNGTSIPVGSANHYIAGFSYETNKYLFDVEGYYKKLDGLTEYSQRLSGNRMSSTLEEHFYNGHGYTSGVEFLAQKKAGKYTGWLSYTMAIARNQFDDYQTEYYSANQDARNEFKSVNMYKFGNWTFSATWIFATGKPYTAPVASYTVDNVSGNSKTFLTISGKNTERMPAYHRLDLAATLDLIKIDSRKTGSISFSLFNVYNRTNIWYKEYTVYNNQVITTNVNYLGLTPNITLSLKWK